MAALSHLSASLHVIDALDVQTLALFVSTDGRPLRGAAGLVDWRLCGALSASIQGGGFRGGLGERLLMPTQGRIGPERLLIYGCGPSSRPFTAEELTSCLDAARRAGADELAIELPEALADGALDALRGFSGKRLVVLGAEAGAQPR